VWAGGIHLEEHDYTERAMGASSAHNTPEHRRPARDAKQLPVPATTLLLQSMPHLLAKFVPLVQTLILVGIDVRARSRFDRLTHHAHGHGGWIAAGGDVGSRFPVARSVDDGASATGRSLQM
jgi:hypothetical protein